MARKKNTAAEGAAETAEAKAKKPRMKKEAKPVALEDILFSCRNKLRGNASSFSAA